MIEIMSHPLIIMGCIVTGLLTIALIVAEIQANKKPPDPDKHDR